MYARIVHIPLLPGTTAGATAVFRDSIGPALKQQPGFANSRALFNQETSQCLLVTLWETIEARTGAETAGVLQDSMEQLKHFFAAPPTINYYDMTVQVV